MPLVFSEGKFSCVGIRRAVIRRVFSGATFAHRRVSSLAASERLLCYDKARPGCEVAPLGEVVIKGGSSFHKDLVGGDRSSKGVVKRSVRKPSLVCHQAKGPLAATREHRPLWETAVRHACHMSRPEQCLACHVVRG
jgi:hypothetical protein